MKWTGTWSYCIGSLIKHRPLEEHSSHFFTPVLPAFRKKQCSSAWSPVYIPSADMIIFQWCKHTHTVVVLVAMASDSRRSWWAPGSIFSVQKPRGQSAEQTMKHRAEIPEAPTHIHWHTRASQVARPDFTELDVFLGQHICWLWNNILIQKCNLDHFPTPKPNFTHE